MIIVFPSIIAHSFSALSIYPFIFLKDPAFKTDYVLINHEKIHLKQQLELFWLIFFAWYFIEYLIKLIYYRNSYTAYKNISFEREAYLHEDDLDYLQTRPKFGFFKYIL